MERERPVQLNGDTILRLKRNDPDLKHVSIHFNDANFREFDAISDVDWEAEGSCISENTHLERLAIMDSGYLRSRRLDEGEIMNVISFFEAVALNSSITSFEIWDCLMFVNTLFDIIAPRFANGLRKLTIFNMDWNIECVRSFISALEGCGNSTLQHIEISCAATSDEMAGELIDAFNKTSHLVKLIWNCDSGYHRHGTGLGNNFIRALSRLLNNPESTLEEIAMGGNGPYDERVPLDSSALSIALANNTKLKRIDLDENTLFGEDEWKGIVQCIRNPESVLEKLCLRGATGLSDGGVPAALFDALSHNKTLKKLDLSFVEGISTEHWLTLARSLKGVPLEEFHLLGNQENEENEMNEDEIEATEINGHVVSSFAPFIIGNTNLRELYFGANEDVDDEAIVAFAKALTKNHKLTTIGFDQLISSYCNGRWDDLDKITNAGWKALSDVLCDTTSIDSMFDSNHVLERVSPYEERLQEYQRLPKDRDWTQGKDCQKIFSIFCD